MLLLIDNFDSFTYNLYQYIGEMYPDILVKRNNEISVNEVAQLAPEYIVISPGPGHPARAGVTIDVIKRFNGVIPLLGICLGHQAIGLAMGGVVGLTREVVHGKLSAIHHNGKDLFRNLPPCFSVVRYHSLCVEETDFPACLEIQACTADGTIMALRHRQYPTFGLQFHPESILTQYGKELLYNFLNIGKKRSL